MDFDTGNLSAFWRPPNFRKAMRWCKADGCTADLRLENDYTNKHKVCEQHRKELTVMVDGQACRWCQRCTKFHDVSQFDADKRSCRFRLQRLKARRRAVYTAGESEDSEGSPLRRKVSHNPPTFQPAPQQAQADNHHRLRSVGRSQLHMPGVLQPPPNEYDMAAHKQADMEWYASNEVGTDMGDTAEGNEQYLIASATDPEALGLHAGQGRNSRARASVAPVPGGGHSPKHASGTHSKRGHAWPKPDPAPQVDVPPALPPGITLGRSPAGSGQEVAAQAAHTSQPATPTSAAGMLQPAATMLQPTTAFSLQPAMVMNTHAAPTAGLQAVAAPNQQPMLFPVNAVAGDVQPGQAPVMLLWIGTPGAEGAAAAASGPVCYAPYFLVPAETAGAVASPRS